MRGLIAGVAIALVAVGCQQPVAGPFPAVPGIDVRPRATSFTEVRAGGVRALIPDRWAASVVSERGSLREGLRASPRLSDWGRMDGSVQGFQATWFDVARGHMPSDFYYLAATGPALSRLLDSKNCRLSRREVIVDHRPTFAHGRPASPGDYVARGFGTCRTGGRPTRWAYFVAAPGYGPVRHVGIPNSGFYLLVTVLPDGPGAPKLLQRVLSSARFGDARISDLVAAARASAGRR